MDEEWIRQVLEQTRVDLNRRSTPGQRLAWLRMAQEFAYQTGELQEARRIKQETSWKYGKQ